MDVLVTIFGAIGYAVIALALIVAAAISFGLACSFMFCMVSEASQRGKPSDWQGMGSWCGGLGGLVWVIYGLGAGGIWSTIVSSLGVLVAMFVVGLVAWRICENRRFKRVVNS